MYLIDGADDQTGQVDTGENRPFRHRVIPILNVLRLECVSAAQDFVSEPGIRPLCPPIEDWDTPIALDDGLCQGVLPYGLAAQLLTEENPDTASFFQQRYEELLKKARQGIPAVSQPILDPYGGIEYDSFGSWQS